MARPLWSGTIQISLVGFAVEVYPATSTTRPISFHEVDRNTMSRVRRENISAGPPVKEAEDASEEAERISSKHNSSLHLASRAAEIGTPRDSEHEADRHSVDRADIVKGYEYEKGKYAIVEPAELKNLRLAGKKTIEISQFAKATEINPALYEKPYFVMPKSGPQATAFHVVRESLRGSGMVGIGEIVFSGRQHLMTLAPPHTQEQPGMMLYTLRFAAELRDAREYSKDEENNHAEAAQLALAKQLIDAYTVPFDVNKFKDHYEEALRELVEAKINHLPVRHPEVEKKPAKVVDLMEALRRSVAQTGIRSGAAASERSRPAVKGGGTADSVSATAKTKTTGRVSRAAAGKKAKSA